MIEIREGQEGHRGAAEGGREPRGRELFLFTDPDCHTLKDYTMRGIKTGFRPCCCRGEEVAAILPPQPTEPESRTALSCPST